MTLTDMVVVEITHGWVWFSYPAQPLAMRFRRTVETHTLFTHSDPVIGDIYRFRVFDSFDGRKDFYYVIEKCYGRRKKLAAEDVVISSGYCVKCRKRAGKKRKGDEPNPTQTTERTGVVD